MNKKVKSIIIIISIIILGSFIYGLYANINTPDTKVYTSYNEIDISYFNKKYKLNIEAKNTYSLTISQDGERYLYGIYKINTIPKNFKQGNISSEMKTKVKQFSSYFTKLPSNQKGYYYKTSDHNVDNVSMQIINNQLYILEEVF